MNMTIPDDNHEIESSDGTMHRSRRSMPRFSSPPDPGNRPPRTMLGIPQNKKVPPKNSIARLTGAAALVMDSLFGIIVYFTIKPYLDTIVSFDWSQFSTYIVGSFNQLVSLKGRELIGFVAIGLIALLTTYTWIYAENKFRSSKTRDPKN